MKRTSKEGKKAREKKQGKKSERKKQAKCDRGNTGDK